jgi:hypothetical protein
MNPVRLACTLAIVGGGWWGLRFLRTMGASGDGSPVLHWAGAVLITSAGVLSTLYAVRRAPIWLRLLVAVAGPVAGWMVLLAAYEPADSADVRRAAVDGVVGALSLLIGLLCWRVGRSESRHRGSHTR